MLNASKTAAAGMATATVALGSLSVPATASGAASAIASGGAPARALPPSAEIAGLGAAAPKIAWKRCPKKDPVEKGALEGLECGSLRVPLDYARPRGEQITLALTRARHTAARSQGVMLLNRGGPGAHGRDLARLFKAGLPKDVAAGYDWIGYDPRGVGASRPVLVCDTKYQKPDRPKADVVPANEAEERAWVRRARAYAADCASKYGRVLPYMGTREWVRDMDAIRAALGQKQINYFGYSYGSYLGAAYASAYPGRVRRMVLDSVVRPSAVWYRSNLDQNIAFEKRIQTYFSWIARHHSRYRLGKTRKAVAASYYRARARAEARPLNGKVGPSELDDIFLADGYADHSWPAHARALSAYVVKRDPTPLVKAWKPPNWLEQNNYTVYNAVQCRDAPWPREWNVWHDDHWRLYRSGYRFETWGNAWYNAPCAFWPVPGGPRPHVHGKPGMSPILLVHATEDAATPYHGALETHRLFPGSRLIVLAGGGNHGVALGGDACVDTPVMTYLRNGRLPADRRGPDLSCPAGPQPKAGPSKKAGRFARGAGVAGVVPHDRLG
ncbi:alpha/beta hydrolase [Actinomadura rugatobispora]|uniref:Alpha/beta hydrolase n=1 Tax=Actinomadura rugatobispora TaxID=1994 RepID=A0ABW1AE82_9ACTN|nr:alpha/beta hydrolase [Actinomadura rugatobispora]